MAMIALRAIMSRRIFGAATEVFSLPQHPGFALMGLWNGVASKAVPRAYLGSAGGHCWPFNKSVWRPSATQESSPPSIMAGVEEIRSSIAWSSMEANIVDRPFLRLSYMSTMAGPEEIALQTVRRVVQMAAQVNSQHGITGRLSYDAQHKQVWQILEGDPDKVLSLWEQIRRDSRHTVDEETVTVDRMACREFPKSWAMQLRFMVGDFV